METPVATPQLMAPPSWRYPDPHSQHLLWCKCGKPATGARARRAETTGRGEDEGKFFRGVSWVSFMGAALRKQKKLSNGRMPHLPNSTLTRSQSWFWNIPQIDTDQTGLPPNDNNEDFICGPRYLDIDLYPNVHPGHLSYNGNWV